MRVSLETSLLNNPVKIMLRKVTVIISEDKPVGAEIKDITEINMPVSEIKERALKSQSVVCFFKNEIRSEKIRHIPKNKKSNRKYTSVCVW